MDAPKDGALDAPLNVGPDVRVPQDAAGDLAGPSCLDPTVCLADFEAFGEALPREDSRSLFRHWLAGWRDGCPPARAAILPEELGRLLPRVFLIEVYPASGRLRYRLIGGELSAAVGEDSSGRYLDEVRARFSAELQARWKRRDRLSVAAARPVYGSWTLRHLGRSWRTMTSLRLPLLEGGRVTHLLGYGTVD